MDLMSRLQAIQSLMSDADMKDPNARYELSSTRGESYSASWWDGYNLQFERFETLSGFEAWATALLSKEERDTRKFVEDLGGLIERGRYLPDVDTAPLTDVRDTIYEKLLS